MFSKNILLKNKVVYEKQKGDKDKDEKITIEVSVKSNHQIEQHILNRLEEDIKQITIPTGYKIQQKD